MRLEFLGAAHTVTGSCYLLEVADKKYLVDCGTYQGAKHIRMRNYDDFRFNPSEIEAVFLTHAHIDHCGLIPKLVKDGYKGSIYGTKETCELAKIMIADSAHIQESDAEVSTRKGQRSGSIPVAPLYTVDDASVALEHFVPMPYNRRIPISDQLSLTFRDAGHILGSAILEIVVNENGNDTKIVFSGDLGQPDQPILKDPTIVNGADYLVIESTYGGRIHQIYDKEQALAEIIDDTMDRGGNLIIPAFAVGRTQTLLYYFYKMWKSGKLDGNIPIVIDSPMAIAATRVFVHNTDAFDDEAIELLVKGGMPEMPQLKIAETAAESRALNTAEGSAIIMSASGMADAGRILHHLKHNLWRPESTVLFVGYQAEGSLGRRLIDGVKRVRIMGEEIAVKAKIESLDGFSAHADANQLTEWVKHITDPVPAKIFIVHGESPSQEMLRQKFQEEIGLDAYVPFFGDEVTLHGRSFEIHPSRIPEVSVEKEMEDYLQDIDEDYRRYRRQCMRIAMKNPHMMPVLQKKLDKAQHYMKKIFEGMA